MGFSFRIAKRGARWQPKPKEVVAKEAEISQELRGFESSYRLTGAENREVRFDFALGV